MFKISVIEKITLISITIKSNKSFLRNGAKVNSFRWNK